MKRYLQEAAKKGVTAAKQNMIPGIILQIIALTLIICYYQIPSFRQKMDVLGGLNIEFSPWFAIFMTMLFGGAIPLIIEGVHAKKHRKSPRTSSQIIFTILVWGINGALTALLYKYQDIIFGSELNFSTVAKKVMVDQFVWVPLYVVPVFTLLFLWRDCKFSFAETRLSLRRKNFLDRALPLMISNWAIWIPSVSIIYAFPLSLQMVLMNLILVFWSLILTVFVSE